MKHFKYIKNFPIGEPDISAISYAAATIISIFAPSGCAAAPKILIFTLDISGVTYIYSRVGQSTLVGENFAF